MLVLVIGGSGSGKSAMAEKMMVSFGGKVRYYLATMASEDSESQKRIARHRKMRQGKNFETIECPLGLEQVQFLSRGDGLLECMSNLTANEIFMAGGRRETVTETILQGADVLLSQLDHLVIVTNNVFEDGLRYPGDTDYYLKSLGEINARLAEKADLVIEAVSGVPVLWKGEMPLCLQETVEEKQKMILITGGAYQGKKAWACRKKNIDFKDPAVYDGSLGMPETLEGIQVADQLHLMVKDCLKQGKSVDTLAEMLVHSDCIVTVDELGCGLVPMDAFDRAYREATGRLCEKLVLHAAEVYRMTCGIPQRIK